MRLTVVGCSGSFPGPDASCSAYLVEHDGFRLLLDLGSGAAGALQRHLDPRDVDALFLSHFHGDHWLDVIPLGYARGHHPDGRVPPALPVMAPRGERERLSAVSGKTEDALAEGLVVHDVREGDVGPLRLRFLRTAHPVETFAIRIEADDRVLVYTADTGPCEELAGFAAGADLLLAEATFAEGEDGPPGLHLTPTQAGALARRAGVGQLVVTHIPPWFDARVQHEIAADAFGGPTTLARSGRVFDV